MDDRLERPITREKLLDELQRVAANINAIRLTQNSQKGRDGEFYVRSKQAEIAYLAAIDEVKRSIAFWQGE